MPELQQVMALLSQWGGRLGPVAQVEPIDVAGRLFLAIADGQQYILKRLDPAIPRERTEVAYQLTAYLAANGVPVALPLLTDAGALTAELQGAQYLLMPSLPSDGPEDRARADTATQYRNVGAAIGRLHRALRSCPVAVPSWTMDIPATIRRDILPALEAAPLDSLRPFLPAANPRLYQTLHAAFDGLPAQRIHGDCHGGNIVIHRGEVSGFIDLDHLQIGPPIYDLGHYLADEVKNQLADPPELWLRHFHLVVEGYRAESSLGAAEIAALWPSMIFSQLLFVIWFLRHHNPEATERNIAVLAWIYEREREIRGGLAALG